MAIVQHVLPRKRRPYSNSPGHIVDKETECWNWTGPPDHKSQAICTYYKGRVWQCERAYYDYFVGQLPDGWIVYQTCENHICVNPKHLAICSFAERQQYLKGTFTLEEVRLIRTLHKTMPLSAVHLYFPDVPIHLVANVCYNQTWKGVK
jgi:hypothetical protein